MISEVLPKAPELLQGGLCAELEPERSLKFLRPEWHLGPGWHKVPPGGRWLGGALPEPQTAQEVWVPPQLSSSLKQCPHPLAVPRRLSGGPGQEGEGAQQDGGRGGGGGAGLHVPREGEGQAEEPVRRWVCWLVTLLPVRLCAGPPARSHPPTLFQKAARPAPGPHRGRPRNPRWSPTASRPSKAASSRRTGATLSCGARS